MLKYEDISELNQITNLLASGLTVSADEMPPEVAEAVIAAKKQMEELPRVIDDLNTAFNRYLTLSRTLARMDQLAREALWIDDEPRNKDLRQAMQDEFNQLAGHVASVAGQRYFTGTSLNLTSQSGARTAGRILSYLEPVMQKLDHELRGQKTIIMEAISETINFMGIIARCYPEATGIENISRTLDQVRLPENPDDPLIMAPTFH